MIRRFTLTVSASLLILAAAALLGPGLQAQIDPPPTCRFGEGGNCFHDTNPCTIDRCNQTTGQCEHVPMTCEGDANLCTTETCNPNTGMCESGPPKSCSGEGGAGAIDGEGGGDGNLCNGAATCNPSTGQCEPGAPVQCEQDSNLCTTESCNPTNGKCESGLPKSCTPEGGGDMDGNRCTTETCNPSTGQCVSGAPKDCAADDNLCTTESCNPENGQCQSGPPRDCSAEGGGGIDGNRCTSDTCNPSTGQCVPGTPKTCTPDDNLCTVEACNPTSGNCESGPPKSCSSEGGGMDANRCTTETCNPSTGQCQPGEGKSCEQDDNKCTTEACNPNSGNCESGPVKSCAQDDNKCNTEACVPSTGACESGEDKNCEGDGDECTTEECNPATGECRSNPTNPAPDGCGAAICRTPGFWGTHAGTEKSNSINITQLVINAAIGQSLSVCGESINSTILNDDASAVEAICVSIQGAQRLQLARQLTAAALNCVMSDGDADCSSTPLYASIFASCNAACANSGSSGATLTSCVDTIDCLNNGGKVLSNGVCQYGNCAGGAHDACGPKASCMDGSACVAFDSNCHSRELINTSLGLNFPSTGAAGSSRACNSATGNTCVVIGSGQSNCPY